MSAPAWLKADVAKSYPTLVRGKGVYVWDEDGRSYLDAAAGVGVASVGYGRDEIVGAMRDQATLLPFAHSLRFENRPAQQLSREVLDFVGWEGACYFTSGGSEAVEAAVKLTVQYQQEIGRPQRTVVIGRTHSFHGNTLAALSIGSHAARRARHAGLLWDIPHAAAPFCYHCPLQKTYPGCHLVCADDVERAILAVGADRVAGFIAEPISGSTGGAFVPPPEYYPKVRAICDRYGVVFLVDEVITGFGRTGTNFGIEHWRVQPDIIVSAKGISGGYAPLGVVIARAAIVDAFARGSQRFEHNFTYAGHPVSCAAGLACLRIIRREELVTRARHVGAALFERLAQLHDRPHVGDIRGRGLLVGIELVLDRASRRPFPQSVVSWVDRACLQEGLIVYPCRGTVDGVLGDHIVLMPPLSITEEEVDEVVTRLSRALDRFEQEVGESA